MNRTGQKSPTESPMVLGPGQTVTVPAVPCQTEVRSQAWPLTFQGTQRSVFRRLSTPHAALLASVCWVGQGCTSARSLVLLPPDTVAAIIKPQPDAANAGVVVTYKPSVAIDGSCSYS